MSEALSHEILYGTNEGAIRLIESGIPLDSYDSYGSIPLIQAVICNKIEIVSKLLEKGALVDQEDITGTTALQWAVDDNHFPICALLLKYHADPNHYSADGQPILVNPILREQHELIALLVQYGAQLVFAKDYIMAKLLGHRFELTGKADILNTDGQFIEIDFEGFYLEFTLGILRRSLANFIKSNESEKYQSMMAALLKSVRILKTTPQLVAKKYIREIEDHRSIIKELSRQDLVIVPVTYRGHAITLIKYGNLFAKCDRGVNHFTDTVIIYHCKNPIAFHEGLVEELIYKKKSDHYIDVELKKILSLDPFVTLPTRSQISGNCSWANVEAAVPAMLFMMLFQGDFKDKFKIAQLKKVVMKFYERWVEWDKDTGLLECIQEFENADRVRRASFAVMMSSVLVQRCHYLRPQEVARAKKILTILTIPEYEEILAGYLAVHSIVGHRYQRFSRLLEACGLDLTTLKLQEMVEANTKTSVTSVLSPLTPLHTAAVAGKLQTIQHLIEDRAMDVNQRDHQGSTALMYAAWKGHLEVVHYLIEKGADWELTNQKGGTALAYALQAQHSDIVQYLQSQKRRAH